MWMHNIDYFKYYVFIHINTSIYVYFVYIIHSLVIIH